MKKILFLALPLMVMYFASCEKDNGKDNNGKDDDGKTEQKLVKSLIMEEGYTISFEYDKNGRIIRTQRTWAHDNSWEITDVTYNDNMIIETVTDSDPGNEIKEEIIHHLDDNGYLIKAEDKWYYSDETQNSTFGATYEYENGKLVKIKDIDDSSETATFQWQDNDIITAEWVYEDWIINIKYSNVVENLNIDFTSLFDDCSYGIASGGIPSRSLHKFKGTTSEHLPQMIDELMLSYELDSDGYVKTVKIKEAGDYIPFFHIEYVE